MVQNAPKISPGDQPRTRSFTPDPGRNRHKTQIALGKWQSGPSPEPPGRGGDKNKIKTVLKYNLDKKDEETEREVTIREV